METPWDAIRPRHAFTRSTTVISERIPVPPALEPSMRAFEQRRGVEEAVKSKLPPEAAERPHLSVR